MNRVLVNRKWKNVICNFYKCLINSVVWKIKMWLKVEINENDERVVEIIDG